VGIDSDLSVESVKDLDVMKIMKLLDMKIKIILVLVFQLK
jgi:hypothetical protein